MAVGSGCAIFYLRLKTLYCICRGANGGSEISIVQAIRETETRTQIDSRYLVIPERLYFKKTTESHYDVRFFYGFVMILRVF